MYCIFLSQEHCSAAVSVKPKIIQYFLRIFAFVFNSVFKLFPQMCYRTAATHATNRYYHKINDLTMFLKLSMPFLNWFAYVKNCSAHLKNTYFLFQRLFSNYLFFQLRLSELFMLRYKILSPLNG